MNVERVRVDRKKARDLYRKYKEHQHYSAPIDREIQRAYQLIAQGRVVIKALESIRTAGLGDDGFPKLALCNATARTCACELTKNGAMELSRTRFPSDRDRKNTFRFPDGSFKRETPMHEWRERAEGMVPIVPIHLRPKRGLANYHVLWEAEWSKVPPRDPYLLRRIGGDLWLVVAAWDLTEVERAVMTTRVSG